MEIVAEKRTEFGKKTKKIRREKKLPAVVYGAGIESISLTIDSLNFIKVFREAGETALVDLKFNGSNEKVLIKEVQVHPVTLGPIHVSFHKVDLTEKIRANIPVEIVGEEESPIVKSGEGLVLTLLNEIEVEALPADLPQAFEVDVSHLKKLDEAITVAELKYDKEKVEIVSAEDEDLVAKIDFAEMEEVEEEEELTEEELVEGVEATEETVEGEEGEDGEEGTEKPEKETAEPAEKGKTDDKESAKSESEEK